MLFDDQISVTRNELGDELTVLGRDIIIDSSAPTSNLEYFIKTNIKPCECADVIIQTGNIVSTYQLANTEYTDIGMKMKRLF